MDIKSLVQGQHTAQLLLGYAVKLGHDLGYVGYSTLFLSRLLYPLHDIVYYLTVGVVKVVVGLVDLLKPTDSSLLYTVRLIEG